MKISDTMYDKISKAFGKESSDVISNNHEVFKVIYDEKFNFVSVFNTQTGFSMRSDVLDQSSYIDPFMASYPELIDVGIMGHCQHGKEGLCLKAGVQCYQTGSEIDNPNMTVSDFSKIVEESKDRLFQIALGGRGDPELHENFEDILKLCTDNRIVPNFTTSGYKLTEDLVKTAKEHVGAIAVSWYRSDYTLTAIDMLLKHGIKTNIHYVLGNNTLDEALDRLKNHKFPSGINAVVFLLHKPVGLGTSKNVLSFDNPKVTEFFEFIDTESSSLNHNIGFDSCTIPGILNKAPSIDSTFLDTCEGGRFSCYISSDMVMVPCSFDSSQKYGVSLKNKSIEEVWNSKEFDNFRNSFKSSCSDCSSREMCLGGCPLAPEIVLCGSKH